MDAVAELLAVPPGDADPLALIDTVRALHQRLGPSSVEPGGPLAVPSALAAAVVRALDHWALDRRRVHRHLAISEIVARRAGYFPDGVDAEVLVPPSCLPDPPAATPPGRDLLSVGRLDGPKRIDLSIRALSRIDDPSVGLRVLGDGPRAGALRALAGGDPRVRFDGRVSDARLAEAYRHARAVVVTPQGEDFGYVAIEALQAGRPVVTTTDSGGPAALVTDGVDGLVVEPDPSAVAHACARLLGDDRLAADLGEAGRATAARHSWPRAVARLLRPPAPEPVPPGRRGRIVAVSTYPITDWRGGGPERARHLLGGLAGDGWEVEVVALAPEEDRGTRHRVDRGLREVTVARSRRHTEAETRLRRLTANVAITDIAAALLWEADPELVGELHRVLPGAAAIVAVHPYLAPAARAVAPGVPVVVDAHNHERALKAQMLPDDEAGRWMMDRVAEVETGAVAGAAGVVATTDADARALEADAGLPAGTISVVPNGVDLTEVPFTPLPERARRRAGLLASLGASAGEDRVAVFVGSAHRPNVDAAREIVDLAEALPRVVFALAGAHGDSLDPREVPANVRLLGTVDPSRLRELLGGADVGLNPMRTGGGSNLKTVQYFAAGVPVLTTPLGVRGIREPSRVATVANVDHFGEALGRLLAESPAGGVADKVDAARELVEDEFDWAVIARRFADLVGRIAEEREQGK